MQCTNSVQFMDIIIKNLFGFYEEGLAFYITSPSRRVKMLYWRKKCKRLKNELLTMVGLRNASRDKSDNAMKTRNLI